MPGKPKRYRTYNRASGPMRKFSVSLPKLKKDVSLLKKQREVHVQDNPVASAVINGVTTYASGALVYGAIAQGTGESDRIGESIQPLQLKLRMRFVGDTTAVQSTFRVLLVHSKNDAGTAPVLGDILSQDLTTTFHCSPYNDIQVRQKHAKTGNYKVIYDKILYVNAPLSGAGGIQTPTSVTCKFLNVTKDLTKFPAMRYTNINGVAADTYSGHIWIFIVEDSAQSTAQFSAQLFYSA